jgi:serine/threonine protein kinase
MYRGRWLDCDVGVKCLNPAAIGLHYSSRAAWIEFLEDANRMGALRHPGLVEVYGVVLPGCLDTRGAAEAPRWSGGGGGGGGGAGGADGDGGDPPLLGARRASWDFGAGALPGRGPSASPSSPPPPPVAPPRVQRLPGPVAAPPALVMEYVEGRSLRGAIARRDDAVAGALARVIYALDCARALAYLHAKGAPHLDFKSDNVLVGRRDRRPMAKVVGYGLTSRKAGVAFYSPGVTMSRGVLPWAAPEIVRAPAKLGPKADVYSFGIVM